MNLFQLNFIIKPFNINVDETVCINILNIGLFKITIAERSNQYELVMHNTSGIKMFDPIDGYNYWMKRFDNLDKAKEHAEEIYKDTLNKLTYNFKNTLYEHLEVIE